MQSMRHNSVKRALNSGVPQIGSWLSLASPIAARFMSRSGFHWLTLDMEHSSADWETAASIFGSVAEGGCIPLVRVPSITIENAKRALDLGAYGIVFPMCNSVEEAELAVAACKYPPVGRRSVGGNLHTLNFACGSAEYYARANDEILVVVQAEHVLAVENIERILSVPGIDAVFIGPNDLLASMGKTPQMETNDPEFVQALERIRTTAQAKGVAPGLHVADAQTANRRVAEGWKFIAVSSELGLMNDATQRTIQSLFGDSNAPSVRY
jgi:4-hydroxy-2-oxoheptanedioate aldolase